jgi:hypothetical protein
MKPPNTLIQHTTKDNYATDCKCVFMAGADTMCKLENELKMDKTSCGLNCRSSETYKAGYFRAVHTKTA